MKVPIEKEKAYIKAQKAFEKAEVTRDKIKFELMGYYEKGYTFSLIKPSDTSAGVFNPPWKQIALELLKKLYPTKAKQEMWWIRLRKRFPKREKAPTLIILGKESKQP